MTLSAAMIVRDEAENLPRVLNSIHQLVDEIVVFDTGSVDNTVEIAESYGCRVFHDEWQDDFAYHRNQSTQACTGQWVLVIDADEEFVDPECDKDTLRRHFEGVQDNIAGIVVSVRNLDGEGKVRSIFGSVRWLRKDAGIYYDYAWHNELKVTENQGWGYAGCDHKINHYGYYALTPAQTAKKHQRMERMFNKTAAAEEGSPRPWYYYAKYLLTIKEAGKAAVAGYQAFNNLKEQGVKDMREAGYYGNLYHLMAVAFAALGEKENAIKFARHGLKYYPEDPDLLFDLGRISEEVGDKDTAEDSYRKFLKVRPKVLEVPALLGGRTFTQGGEDFAQQAERYITQ